MSATILLILLLHPRRLLKFVLDPWLNISNSMAGSEMVVWKVIAATNFGSAEVELVSCQVVDI